MKNYLILGSGRWALHLQKSLALAGISHGSWARKTQTLSDLQEKLTCASHVWLAVSDQALPEWAEKLRSFDGPVLHSSGALEIGGLHCVHPLMSFSNELYSDDFYSRFAFVTTSPLPREDLIASLPNPFFRIEPEQKTFYHAMCVLAGNGSVLLWQKFLHEMRRLGISNEASTLYARRIVENLANDPARALTGPLVRNDQITLQADLHSLAEDPFQGVLAALIEAYARGGKELV